MAELHDVREWALTQKRVTNKRLRDEFNFDEVEADAFYQELRAEGIIVSGGYVQEVTAAPKAEETAAEATVDVNKVTKEINRQIQALLAEQNAKMTH